MFSRLVVRRRVLPGVYAVEGMNAHAAWVLLEKLREMPGVFPHYASYEGKSATKERFSLPPDMFPGFFRSDARQASSAGTRYGWSRFSVPSVEVVSDELTPGSHSELCRGIGERPELLVRSLTDLRLADWSEIVDKKVSRRDRIGRAVSDEPDAVLAHGDRLSGVIDVSSCQALQVSDQPVPEWILLPADSMRPSPCLGEKQTRFRWEWGDRDRESTSLNPGTLDEKAFAEVWNAGADVCRAKRDVADLYVSHGGQDDPVSWPVRLRDLVRESGVKRATWKETVHAILTAQADEEYARQVRRGADQTFMMWMKLSAGASVWGGLFGGSPPDWMQRVDFLKVGLYVDLLEPLEMPDGGRGSVQLVCQIVPGEEGSFVSALERPDCPSDRYLDVWLVEGLSLA